MRAGVVGGVGAGDGEHRVRLVDVDRHRGGSGVVVGGIGRGEEGREGLAGAGVKDRAHAGGVLERGRARRIRGVELGGGQKTCA